MDGGNEAFILFVCLSITWRKSSIIRKGKKGEKKKKKKKNNLQLPDIFYTTRHFWSKTGLMTAIVVAEPGSLITRSLVSFLLSLFECILCDDGYTQQMDRRIWALLNMQ